MINAAGVLFYHADTRSALFLLRSETAPDYPLHYDFPGGAAEDDEEPEATALREAREEVGKFPDGERAQLTRSITRIPAALPLAPGAAGNGAAAVATPAVAAPLDGDEVCYVTFLQKVGAQFEPRLSSEHSGYAWAPVEAPPQPLHPGCQVALDRLTMDELGVARAIVSGALTSPQRYENVTLFDIRITGTNTAYRRKLDEFAYRPPEHYMTPDFLARCSGLPVVMEHPEKATLTSREFDERIVGTVFLPYLSDGVRHPPDEVWAVAKLYDDAAIRMMSEQQLSTSPAVVFRDPDVNQKLTLDNGSTLLIEGKPSLLDHIAICPLGVWDKGGEPSGVVRGDSDMPTPEELKATEEAKNKSDAEEAARKKADAEAGEAVDKLLKCVDDLGKRMDAYDEDEKKRKDALPEELKEHEFKKDARRRKDDDDDEDGDDEDGDVRRDKKRKDGEVESEDFERKDARRRKDKDEEEMRKDSADLDARIDARARAMIADVEKKIPKALSDADYEEMASAQSRADSVFASLGKRAPRPMDGESLLAYRRRLAGELKTNSAAWKDVNLTVLADDALPIAEAQIYADSMAVARNPIDLGEGELRTIVRRDEAGREVKEFAGRPRSWMGQFSGGRRQVVGIKTKTV